MTTANSFEKSAHYRIVALLLLLWWVGFLYPNISTAGAGDDNLADEATEQGNFLNQVLVFGAAGLGLFHLPEAWRRSQSSQARNLLVFASMYCAWCAATIYWSYDSGLSIRRLGAFGLMLVAAWGIGAGFYSRTSGGVMTLARHILWAAAAAIIILLPTRLVGLSLEQLLNPTFNLKMVTRAAFLLYPVGYGALCAWVVFESATLARLAWTLILYAVLVLMKTRTMMGNTIAAQTLLASRVTPDKGVGRLLAIAAALQLAIFGDLATGGRVFIANVLEVWDQLAPWLPWLTVGGGVKDVVSLNGRVPLWEAVYRSIALRPWQGYGFGAYWTPDHIHQMFRVNGWHVVVAHNGFLDEVLATGIIGLALFLLFWFYAISISVQVARRYDRTGGFLVVSFLVLYLLFNTMDSVNQSFFKVPFFFSSIGVFAIMARFVETNDQEHPEQSEPARELVDTLA